MLIGWRQWKASLTQGILSKRELQEFSMSQRYLWSVRCHLHLRAGREDDRLTFDAQMDIAPQMGFKSRSGMQSVERFMRRYHIASKDSWKFNTDFLGRDCG